jgi:hypothetical protein
VADRKDLHTPAASNDAPAAPTISEMLGMTLILPGESEQNYQAGLAAVIQELGAKTTLQVYIAEKIHDCLWWIRRYEDQKRVTIISEMARQLRERFKTDFTQLEIDVREALLVDDITSKVLAEFGKVGHSMESARQQAFDKRQKDLFELDQQIALQVKILASFQASYEVVFNLKLNVERLRMQNELLRRDLNAIDTSSISAQISASSTQSVGRAPRNDKPKTARRKSR